MPLLYRILFIAFLLNMRMLAHAYMEIMLSSMISPLFAVFTYQYGHAHFIEINV